MEFFVRNVNDVYICRYAKRHITRAVAVLRGAGDRDDRDLNNEFLYNIQTFFFFCINTKINNVAMTV